MLPTLGAAAIVVVLAFLLGRMTVGDNGTEVSASSGPVATTTTTAGPTTHTVAQGESLLAIASRYGLTLDQLAAANGITNANHVFVGQVLQIPPSTIVTTLPSTTSTTAAKSKAKP